MALIELPGWPGVEDYRPIKQEDVFQNEPFKVAVNSNRGRYTDFGMGDVLAEQGRKAYEQIMNEDKEINQKNDNVKSKKLIKKINKKEE